MLEVKNLSKTFRLGNRNLTVLHDISFGVAAGQTIALAGPSGSGKTTLLGLCAGLDLPTSGSVILNGIRLDALDEDDRAWLRNQQVGFVFQHFELLPTLTALENVMVPLSLRGERNARKEALEWLNRVGLGDRTGHFPAQLSGGEQQRVAIARAFVSRPAILFADEPTGNLDHDTAESITGLLFDLNREQGTTLVLVTHNEELAHRTGRILHLKGGKIEYEEPCSRS